jgi:hypothetical protein
MSGHDWVDPDKIPVEEIELQGPSLLAAARILGLRCRQENLAFVQCKQEDENPVHCIEQGRAVTLCGKQV